jgi:hypothetical protein
MTETQNNGISKMETLNGGALLEAIHLDGAIETVKVLQLSVRQYQQLRNSLDDELKVVELYCGKPEGWAETLTPASHSAIAEKGGELNNAFFGAWARRSLNLQELIMPGIVDRAIERANSASPTTSPKSPSNAESRLGRRPSTVLPS